MIKRRGSIAGASQTENRVTLDKHKKDMFGLPTANVVNILSPEKGSAF